MESIMDTQTMQYLKQEDTLLEKLRKSRTVKGMFMLVVLSIMGEIVAPTAALALTSGPSSPEFASYEPVATTDMVNEFSGDFTYNLPIISIPGPDGAGTSLSLSYHSGFTPEEDAGWVGAGFTLNPGAINRGKRGLADDFKGADIIHYNKQKPNWTATSGFDANMEYNSKDDKSEDKKEAQELKDKKAEAKKAGTKAKLKFSGINGIGGTSNTTGDDILENAYSNDEDENPFHYKPSISFQHSIRFNNNSGFSTNKSFGTGYSGMASLSMNRSGGETTLGYSVNPMKILGSYVKTQSNKLTENLRKTIRQPEMFTSEQVSEMVKESNKAAMQTNIANYASRVNKGFNNNSFSPQQLYYSVAYLTGKAYNYSLSLQINPYGPLGFQFGIQGSMNYQVTQPDVTQKGYGYMYNRNLQNYINTTGKSFEELGGSEIIQGDYFLEKESTFEKHDHNLGIPLNSADAFSMTGNGVMGGFQIQHGQIGHFYPNFTCNKQQIRQLGLEVGIGGTIEVGFDVGLGSQKTEIGDWRTLYIDENDPINALDMEFLTEVNEDYSMPTMRFSGDMGGEVAYTGDDAKLTATIKGLSHKLNLNSFLEGTNYKNHQKTQKDGRSSSIRYSVYNESGALVGSQSNVFSVNAYAGLRNSEYAGLIGQISVTDKSGGRSVYGIPVFTKNELELSVGIKDDDDVLSYVKNKNLFATNPLDNYTVVGTKTTKPWASTYLLTEQTGVDYIDVDGNGPSLRDFGSWVKYGYTKVYGDGNNNNNNDWYRYRAPYTGLFYNRGRLNDLRDGTGSMSSGDKEMYYLKTIDTKTHIAFFITNKTTAADFNAITDDIADLGQAVSYLEGSQIDRKDGRGAKKGDDVNGVELASKGETGSDPVRNLEKIVLFAKSDMTKPISTTYFEYDYKLCGGTPNSGAPGGQKLTLKKVWSEGGGVTRTKIAPYTFEYAYYRYDANGRDEKIMEKYPFLSDVYSNLETSKENPNYQVGQLDAWGNYQPNSSNRFKKMQPWLDQRATNFDPAAWQLKRIVLPSGGEIHVQYEQKDYSYVANKRAAVMVNLSAQTTEGFNEDNWKTFGYKAGSESRYYIDATALNFQNSEEENSYVTMLQNHFINEHEKLYYKFLYTLRDDGTPVLEDGTDLQNYKRDYIEGYISVNNVGKDAKGIYLELGDSEKNGKNDKNLPRWVGFRTLLTNGLYALSKQTSEDTDVGNGVVTLPVNKQAQKAQEDDDDMLAAAYNSGNGQLSDDVKNTARGIALENTFDYFGGWVSGKFNKPHRKNICKAQNFELSYFKLPAYHSKKGGGCRVKRLLSYDPGIENGDAMVYGTEYAYKFKGSNLSSGVATFEPGTIREENALVTILERKKQRGLDRLLNGRDSKTMEGPLGESLYPAPSIGYERVVTKNIHSGKTTTGYAVSEYHTVREHPMLVHHTELNKDDDTYKKLNFSLPLGLINVEMHKAWVTQGYLFTISDMHGKPERTATYAGNYSSENDVFGTPTAETTYSYTSGRETVKGVSYDHSNSKFKIEDIRPGQEEDLTMYRCRVEDITNNLSLELDLNITLPLAITVGGAISYNYERNELSQHVTTKVMHQVSYLKSTTSTVDGVTQTTENLAYDKYTGDPVLTRTYDGYTSERELAYMVRKTEAGANEAYQHKGHYYAMNIPGSWMYPELGQNWNVSTNRNELSMAVGSVVTYGENALYNAILGNQPYCDNSFTSVISASQTILKKDRFLPVNNTLYTELYEEHKFSEMSDQVAVLGKLNAIYLPYRSYVFRDKSRDANVDYINRGGVLRSTVSFIDWITGSYGNTENDWFSASKILAYSPNGVALAEEDILGIRSIVKFGDDKTLPLLTAQNANYNQVFFKDFENLTNTADVNYVRNVGHTGRKSIDLRVYGDESIIKGYDFSGLGARGVTMKVWLKSNLSTNLASANYGKKNSNPQLKAIIGSHTYSFKAIAQTGEWTLFEASMQNLSGLTGQSDIRLSYNFLSGEEVFVDDVRIQPMDAAMSCIVYTKDKKVDAQFDSQHFAVFFEYNKEGLLLRKSIETEKGRKTVQEQQQNVPLQNK